MAAWAWLRRFLIVAMVLFQAGLLMSSLADHEVARASIDGAGAGESLRQAGCQPRPAVRTSLTSLGENRFAVTVTAGLGPLVLLRFRSAPSARLDLPGLQPGITPPFEVKAPDGAATYSFEVRSVDVDTPLTVPLTVYDRRGFGQPWSTFVGGGQNALRLNLSIADTTVTEGDGGTGSATFTVSAAARPTWRSSHERSKSSVESASSGPPTGLDGRAAGRSA